MERIMVGMSGGVDSTVAALILLDAGYDVSGGTMVMFRGETSDEMTDRASTAAESLGIDHFVFDVTAEFKREVQDTFAAQYMRGETPNPCAICNRTVKFPAFQRLAAEKGILRIATGHYVRSSFDESAGRWILKKGLDETKDQSYFLYGLTQDMLSKTVFPLGEMTKKQVREMAKDKGLSAASRSDSQDICFLPNGGYADFIRENYGVPVRKGVFLDMDGNVLGYHDGALGYTIGQRRGMGVSYDGRLYVVKKDMDANTVTLGRENDLCSSTVRVRDINLVSVSAISGSITADVKLRYSRKSAKARITMTDGTHAVLEFSDMQRAPTAGQAAVFYDGEVLLGGGIIE